MGRHADALTAAAPPRRRGSRVIAALLALTLAAVLGAAATPAVLPGVLPGVRGMLPWFPAGADCPAVAVELVAVPSVQHLVEAAVAPVQGRGLADGGCLQVRVRGQEPAETVASSEVIPPAQAPQLWVGDSSLWTTRVTAWKTQQAGSLGTSPVVLISSVTAVQRLGWAAHPPSWTEALDGTHQLATPALAGSAASQLALLALWQSAGKGSTADRAVAAAVLAAGRTRPVDGQTPIEVAAGNAPNAALIPTSELDLVGANRDAPAPNLVAVYPREGSPLLDYPVLRVSPQLQTPARSAAVDVVLTALAGPAARAAAAAAGMRGAGGARQVGGTGGTPGSTAGQALPGVGAAALKLLPTPSAADLTGFLRRLAGLAAPSRILAVIDVSVSMRSTVAGTGLSRVELAGKAATAAGELLTDSSSVGLWAFALNLDGAKPYRELVPVRPLGEQEGSSTHRQTIYTELARLDSRITGGGTGLYETALAAVRAQRASFDPRAVNTVVLFTDGSNENDSRVSLDQLVQALTLDAAAAPGRPVRLVGIGLGAAANLEALRTMVAPTGGAAYRADSPAALQKVLFDALARRT